MKKKVLEVVSAMIMMMSAGCDAAQQMAQEAKDQMEWAEEHNALANGQTPDSDIKDIVTDIADSILDTESLEETTSVSSSSSETHQIGDTVPMTVTIDGETSTFNITVTGCEPVYNDIENCTAVLFTVNCTGGEFMFENSWFDMYADSTYVESGNWNGYTTFDFSILREGMTYEGCYVGKTDYNDAETISVFLGDEEWVIPVTSVNNVSNNPSPEVESDYLDWGGIYSDGTTTVTITMYSSPDETSMGHISGSISGYEINCELQYYSEDHMIVGVDSDIPITVYCSDEDGVKTISLYIVYGTGFDTIDAGPLTMTEHFES